MIDFCSQPEPIFIPSKQLLPHRFPFTRSEVAGPVILAHLKSLFYIGFRRQKSKCPRVHCGGSTEAKIADGSTTMAANREVVQKRTFAKGFTRNFSVFLDDVVAEPRSDLVDLLN